MDVAEFGEEVRDDSVPEGLKGRIRSIKADVGSRVARNRSYFVIKGRKIWWRGPRRIRFTKIGR